MEICVGHRGIGTRQREGRHRGIGTRQREGRHRGTGMIERGSTGAQA